MGALSLPPARCTGLLVKGSDGGLPWLSLAPPRGSGFPRTLSSTQLGVQPQCHPGSPGRVPPVPCTVQTVPVRRARLSRGTARGCWQPGIGPRATAGTHQRNRLVLEGMHVPTVFPGPGMGVGWRSPGTGRGLQATPASGLPWEAAAACPCLRRHGKRWPACGV